MRHEERRILDIALDRAIDDVTCNTPSVEHTTPSACARRVLGNAASYRLIRLMDPGRDEYREFGGRRAGEEMIDL